MKRMSTAKVVRSGSSKVCEEVLAKAEPMAAFFTFAHFAIPAIAFAALLTADCYRIVFGGLFALTLPFPRYRGSSRRVRVPYLLEDLVQEWGVPYRFLAPLLHCPEHIRAFTWGGLGFRVEPVRAPIANIHPYA